MRTNTVCIMRIGLDKSSSDKDLRPCLNSTALRPQGTAGCIRSKSVIGARGNSCADVMESGSPF